MSTMKLYSALSIPRSRSARPALPRIAIAIQLSLLVLLVVGRAVGAVGDAPLLHSRSPAVTTETLSTPG